MAEIYQKDGYSLYDHEGTTYNAKTGQAHTPTPPPAPAPAAPPASPPPGSTPSPYYPRYTANEQAAQDYLETPVKERSVEEIQAEKTKAAQGQIDALNRHYDALLAEQRTINEGRDRSTSSVSTLTGLAGSTEANVAQGKTTTLNQRDNEKIQAERGAAIQQVLSSIRTSAVEEARQSRLEARQSAQDILAGRTKRQQEATTHLTNLAKGGVTIDGLKQSDPQAYDYLVRSVGSEEEVKAMFTLNRPVDSIVDKRVENGKYIIAYQNPLDGKIRLETVDLGIPQGYSKTLDAGDRILAVPDNWDGDPSKLITINKGLTPDQAADNANKSSTTEYGGYTEKQAKALTALNEKVSNNATYKKTASMRGFADNVIASLSLGNGVGDIAAINQFQKVIDEGAVTRDQDVKLIQSAQSLMSSLKTKIKKLERGDQLSADQRTQIRTLVENMYQAQIKALQKDPYITAKTKEADIYGLTLGDTILGELDGFNRSESKILVKDGQSFDASELSEEEYEQALADGYEPQ